MDRGLQLNPNWTNSFDVAINLLKTEVEDADRKNRVARSAVLNAILFELQGLKEERINTMAEINRILESIYTKDEIRLWLSSWHPQLGDKTPNDLFAQGKLDEVLAIVRRIDEAVYV